MADNIITTNITAHADFTSLRAQLAAVTAQLIKLQETTAGTNAKLANQIAVMNKAFATTLTSTGQFSQHFVSLSSDVDKFGKNLDRGRLKLNEYYNVWNGHTKKTSNLVRDLAKQQVMLQQAIVQPVGKNAQGLMQYNVMVAKGLDEVKNKMAIATQQAAIMNKVMLDGSTSLINWGKNTQWAGRQLTVGLTVPLIAFGAAAQKAFREADAELVRLTKVYGGLAATSSADLAQVRKDVTATAKEIASSYGVAYKETIALAADLAATGQQGNELIAATQQTTRLAVLGEVDRQEAMKATLAIQNAFKQNTDELTASIDFLNAVENQTSTSLADLTEAIPKAGPVIKSLGGDVKDLALYLTAMKEGGVNASEGANAIKSAMASLINPTKVATEQFAGFGIDLKGIVNNNAGNLTATIVELQGALDKLNPLDKSRAIEQLFGKFQFARMSALFENLGKSGSQTLQVMDLMKASAVDLASISERELKMMTESASGQFKRAWAAVQADLASAGEQFLRISTKVLKVVDAIIKFFQKLPEPVKTFLNALGGLTAIAGPLIMMTGVMGNFIGYIIKGIFHIRQLAKGGQGFKLLTPEIIAADAAAKGLATSFYSDTEATIVLTNAVNTLAESFMNLEAKANAAKVSVQPAVTTVAGGVIMSGTPSGQRVVDKDHPLVGRPYSRDMSHLIPSGNPQDGTIFGTVPGSKPVNIRVGRNPQAYMDGDLPKIPGLTSVGGTSTGIVAAEAAKWHAMTAAISMQSEAEIALLKKEVMATGTVTSSLSDSYQALLPEFTEITQLAAAETRAIVQQVQQSKITVEQARARIIQLNATVEAMLAETTRLTAAGMGRTANLTTVPLTTQPVVDPATGKANMKEMFHKGPTKALVDRIARALGGVRTSGAGYNIETTKPKLKEGGFVPGTGNTDTYHTTAEAGAFVINKASTQEHLPLITNILGGKSYYAQQGGQVPVVLTPGEAVIPASIAQNNMPLMYELNGGPGNTSGGGAHIRGGSILAALRAVTQRGRQYKAKALLEHAGIPIPHLQNSVYPFSHSLNLMTRNGGTAAAREFAATFKSPDAFKLANAVLARNGLRPITPQQHAAVSKYLNDAKKLDPDLMLTEAGFGTHLTKAYQSAGVSRDQLVALAEKSTMRFAFPGSGSIVQRRDALIKKLQDKYPEGVFAIDPKNNNNIIVKMPGEKPFKIEHESTRSTHLATGGVSYETLRQPIPAGSDANGKLAYGHIPIDETLLNAGGKVPGRMAQRLFPGGPVFLGMPRSIKQVEAQRAARAAMVKADQAVKDSRFSKEPLTTYDEMLAADKVGHSFPVPGIGGVYSRNGEKFFVKPMQDETGVLGETRGTAIYRGAHEGPAPDQRVVVIKDPTDPTGRRRVLAAESPYDPRFADMPDKFDEGDYFKQLVASALRGDKDLARGNLGGSRVADVGTAGVFDTASGIRQYSSNMPAFKHQAMMNLLGVKGSGAKRFFAESTASIPKGMTADQYHERMLKEIEAVLPRLKQTISRFDLNAEEKVVYNAMIQRLEAARKENYRDLHGIHSALEIAPAKTMTPAALAKMAAADELRRRQTGHAVSLSDNAFKTPENGFVLGGLLGAITKGKALHRIGAGFGKDSTGGWGVTSLEIGMAEKLFASTGLTKRTQRLLYDKVAAELAKEMPYGYAKNAQGQLLKALEPNIMDSVIRSAAGSTLSDPAGRKVLSAIDREILRKKFANWESKKDTPLTESLKRLIFNMEGREKGGPVNSGQPYIVGEKGPEIFVPRNAGGIVPNNVAMPQGYNAGGFIKMMLMQLLGGYGGQALGKASGIPGGDMIGLMLGSMLGGGFGGGPGGGAKTAITERGKFTRPLGQTTAGARIPFVDGIRETRNLTEYGKKVQALSASKNVFAKAGGFALKAVTRLNIAVGATALVLAFAKNRWDANTESMRLNALGYGMTEEGAKKAGLKFRDFNKSLKESVELAKATREQNQLLYQSMTGSGTPLNITIAEFRKLKKSVKSDFEDQIKLIDKTSADDQIGLAERLKTQFIGMGMTSEEATKKIYTMYTLSKNFSASASLYTVAADGFNKIKTAAEAAGAAIKIYNQSVHEGRDGTEQANALTTANAAMLNAIEKDQEAALKNRQQDKKLPKFISTEEKNDLMRKSELETMERISKEQRYQKTISQATLDELEKTNPVLFEIATLHDTNTSLLQKQRLIARGFVLDMRELSAAQVDQVYRFNLGVTQSIESVGRVTFLKANYDKLNSLKQLQEKYTKAMKGQSAAQQISDRDKLSALQKQIDANNKLADSRIKALDAAKKEGDLGREIAKAQARYEAALATGNTADAQQASLDMQGFQSDLQYNAQVKAIQDSTTLANAPLLKQIELIQKKQQGVADAAALAADKFKDVSGAIDKEESAINTLIRSMANYRTAIDLHKDDLAKWKTTDEAKGMIAAITKAAQTAMVDLKPYPVDPQTGKPGTAAAEGLMGALEQSLIANGLVVNGDLYINGEKLNVKLNSQGALANPDKIADPSRTTGNGLDKPYKYFSESGKPLSKKDFDSMPVGAASDGKEYVVPLTTMQNKEFRDWNAANLAFMKANAGRGQYVSGDLVYGANGSVTKDGKYVGRWFQPLPGGSGRFKSYESGGKVSGPGTGTSDSIPAYLSNGEYVIKEKAVRHYGLDTFDALNAQKFATGGLAMSTNIVAPGPLIKANPAINPDSTFGRIAEGLMSYLGNLPKSIVTSGISGGKYIAGAATGNSNWMDPKDEKMYQQALRDKENGQYLKGLMPVMGRLATSAVDVVPKLINWNKLWAKAGMKDLPGQTEYLLAQLPGEVIQDLLKNLIPGNYAEGGPVSSTRKSVLNQIDAPYYDKNDARFRTAGGTTKQYNEITSGDFTKSEEEISDLIHAWTGLLNTYYGAKYENVFRLNNKPSLLENPIVTDTEVANSRNWASLIDLPPAFKNVDTKSESGNMLFMQPSALLTQFKNLLFPKENKTFTPWHGDPLPKWKKDFNHEKYSDDTNKRILDNDEYKLSLLGVLSHEFGHALQGRFEESLVLGDKQSSSKIFKDKNGKPLGRNDLGEMNADQMAGAIISEMFNAGYMKNIVSSGSVTKYLKKEYLKYAADPDKTNTDIDPKGDPHAENSKYRYGAYVRGFKDKDTDKALADYMGVTTGDLFSSTIKARSMVADLSNFKLKSDNFDENAQTAMPDLLNTKYAEILGLKISGNKSIQNKALDIRTPNDFGIALINALGGTPTENLLGGIKAWSMQEGGHWNNKALYNPLNTTLEMPGSKKINTVNAKTGTGVQAYTSWDQGLDAVLQTLQFPDHGYEDIISALTNSESKDLKQFYSAINKSDWGHPKYNFSVDNKFHQKMTKYNPNMPFGTDPNNKNEWYSELPSSGGLITWPLGPGGGDDNCIGLDCPPGCKGDMCNNYGPGEDPWDKPVIPDYWPKGEKFYNPKQRILDHIEYAYPLMPFKEFSSGTLQAASNQIPKQRTRSGLSIAASTGVYNMFKWGGKTWAKAMSSGGEIFEIDDFPVTSVTGKQVADATVKNVIDRPFGENFYYWPNGGIGSTSPGSRLMEPPKNSGITSFELWQNWLEKFFLTSNGETGFKNALLNKEDKERMKSWDYKDHPDSVLSRFANGGLATKINIPKFETGINSVPANMLAMLHKNEAVIPANMNPFNPNANNATMNGATYNITNNINGFDGDINQLSNIVTQKTITAIGSLTARTAAMSGPTMTVGIK